MKDHRITVRFPVDLRRRLKQAAQSKGTRESDLVRGAVEQHLAAEDRAITAYERAKAAGLIGAVREQAEISARIEDTLMGLAGLDQSRIG